MAKAKSNFSADVLKKNLFWFFVPIAVLLVWGVFFVADSKAKAALKARIDELNGAKTAAEGVVNNREQPNQGTIDDAKAKEEDLRKVVYKSWEVMYDVQKQNCTWSDKLDPRFTAYVSNKKWMSPISDVERREWYHTFIANQIPEFLVKAERRTVYVLVPDPNSKKTPQDMMKNPDGSDRYYPIDPYVADPDAMLQQNAKLISAGSGIGGMMGGMGGGGGGMAGGAGGGGSSSFATTAGSSMGGGATGGGGSEMGQLATMAQSYGTTLDSIYDPINQKVEGIVDWANPEIFTIVTWSGQSPYSGQIWYAQEEVWVYDSLIQVVRNINKSVKATGPHNAAVKSIQAMLIGRNAAGIVGSPGILEPLGSASGAMGMGMGMGGAEMMESSGGTGVATPGDSMEGGGMSSGPMTEESTLAYLKKFRYVGEDLKPLSDTDTPPFAEFNMMPVCLELIVDQRKIPDILVECANSTMPIDIKLVRYNPANARTGLIAGSRGGSGGEGGAMGDMGIGGMPGASGGAMPGGAGGGLGGRSGMGANAGMEAAAEQLSGFEVGGKFGAYGSDAVMIQIVGIIYIYNEPSEELLATGASAQESGIDGGVNPEDSNQNDGVIDSASSLTPDVSVVPDDVTTVNEQ